MFQKPFKVKSNSAIKTSDRKKWKTQIEERFPRISPSDLAELVPSKGEISLAKIFTHGGALVSVLCVKKTPLFFEVEQAIYPTVYALWKLPDILPAFTTGPQVIPRLIGGADLMLPGIILPDGDSYGPNSFGNHEKGVCCAVNQCTNKVPVAVGKTALSSSDMFLSAKRGKGVIILHTYMDHLWAMGDKATLPSFAPPFELLDQSNVPGRGVDLCDSPMEEPINANLSQYDNCPVTQETVHSEHVEASIESLSITNEKQNDDCSVTSNDKKSANGSESENEEPLAVPDIPPKQPIIQEGQSNFTAMQFNSMDHLMTYCFLKAWKTSAKKVELPLLTSNFFGVHMLGCMPQGHTLDVKKSSYKKLSKFLQEMQKREFIQVKELSKGVESIVSVNFLHPEVRSFTVDKNDVPEPVSADSSDVPKKQFQPPQIEELYLTSAAVMPIFKIYSYGKGSALLSTEVRQILTNYVKDNNLQNATQKSLINLDPVLAHVLLTKNENNEVHLKWDEAITRCISKMNTGYRITFADQEPRIIKGKIEPIKLSIATRAANKKVTLVSNLETYGIEPHELAHTVQIGVAASTSVYPAANAKLGSEVLIQGNQVKFLARLLLEQYKIPRKYIEGLELVPKKGRK